MSTQAPAQQSRFCSECGHEIRITQGSCDRCNAPVMYLKKSSSFGYSVNTVFCINCRTELHMDDKICHRCGTPVNKGDKAVAKADTILHRLKYIASGVFIGLLGIGFLVSSVGGNDEAGVAIMLAGLVLGGALFLIGFVGSVLAGAGAAANGIKKAVNKRQRR